MTAQDLVARWSQDTGGNEKNGRLLSAAESKQLLQAAGLPVSGAAAPGNGVELRITIEQDPVLGPVMAVGFGRMAMEVWEDIAYRVVPLAKKDARPMLNELKGARRLFAGYRQMEAVNVSQVEDLLLAVSGFVTRTPQVHTMELSPVYGTRAGVAIRDARIELRTPQ